MLKKVGVLLTGTAAALTLSGGIAAAAEYGPPAHHDDAEQVGLVDVNNLDALHDVNGTIGVCGNNINVLIVQVPIQDSLNGIGVPLLSPGAHEAAGESPENCASGGIVNGGSVQGN